MLSGKKKLQILAASATLLLFAVGIACNGFFVDPVLTTVTVGPTATINQGGTVQESAVGTYNDGSTNSLTNVQWSSDTTSVATISASGLVTGVSVGQTTITGASGTVSGTSTVTVALNDVTAIKISPTTNHAQADGGTAQYTAAATVSVAARSILPRRRRGRSSARPVAAPASTTSRLYRGRLQRWSRLSRLPLPVK